MPGFPPPPPPPSSQGPSKRDIPKDHPYDPAALKPLSKMLWAMSVALGHALTAQRQFSKIKSSTISPDGMLGGRGYVMPIKDVRKILQDACEALSTLSDTIHDEINAPHWKPRLAQLDDNEAEDIRKFIEESTKVLENPEEESGAERDMKEIEEANDGKTAAMWKAANSSVPVDSLPGPRVDHLGPAEGQGPSGSYNRDDPPVDDDWSYNEGTTNEYLYPSEWDNNTSERTGEASGLPSDPDTRTEGWDFGMGFGAHGQGAGGYGVKSPSGGVWGPASGLPDNPGAGGKGNTNTEPQGLDESGRNLWAANVAQSTLPQDVDRPVARSDYFTGPKGNIVAWTGPSGSAALPPDSPADEYEWDRDLPNASTVHERHDTPYIKWDYGTHNYRQDPPTLQGDDEHG